MTQIIIADDHPMVQAALRAALTTALPGIEIIACYTLEGVSHAVAADPSGIDLILLDLGMPGAHGFSALFLLLAEYPTIPVAIISAMDNPQTIRRSIAYGASGFLPKSLSLPDLARAIGRILAGDIWTPPKLRSEMPITDEDSNLLHRFSTLSPQQVRILMMIVDGKLNKQIASTLNVAEQTVKIHVSTIFRKLGVRTRTQAAVLIERFQALS